MRPGDTKVYFTENSTKDIGSVQTSPSLSGFAQISSNKNTVSAPWGIVDGPDGNLWFTEIGTSNKVGNITANLDKNNLNEFNLPANSSPQGITAGADNNLWVAETGTHQIAMVTQAGAVTQYSTPTSPSAPTDITLGPDGFLWFTESTANRLGVVTYPLIASDVTALSTGDSSRYTTGAWATTSDTSTYTQAVTLAPAAPVIPSVGAAVSSVVVVLNYQMATGTNSTAGFRIRVSNDRGTSYSTYVLPNPRTSTCPTAGGGATEVCTFSSPNVQVVLTIPSSVIGNTTQLQAMLIQLQAAPGSGSGNPFTLAFDLAHVDVN
jgi:hypothetical protein